MAKTICIYNQKGGVGKTTTTINLSAALAQKDLSILVVDFDPQANTSSGFGQHLQENEYSVYDLLSGSADLIPEAIRPLDEGLHLLASSADLTGFEIEAIGMEDRHLLLKKLISSLQEGYDFILIDCPPALGMLSLNALCAADSVIIPIQTEYYALEGLSQLTSTVEMVRQSMNPDLEIEGILLTMYDSRTNLAKDVVTEVNKYFNELVFDTVIPRNIRLAEAPSFGQSVLRFAPKSSGAEAYEELAEEVIERNGKEISDD